MGVEPVQGKPLRIPPGHVEVRLTAEHRSAYRQLYARYQTVLDGLPVLRERDFDGRPLRMRRKQLEALNRAFAALGGDSSVPASVFDAQQHEKTRLFKRLLYLS